MDATAANASRVMRALEAFGRVRSLFDEIDVDVIGRDAFIRNKRATGRTRDLADIEDL